MMRLLHNQRRDQYFVLQPISRCNEYGSLEAILLLVRRSPVKRELLVVNKRVHT